MGKIEDKVLKTVRKENENQIILQNYEDDSIKMIKLVDSSLNYICNLKFSA